MGGIPVWLPDAAAPVSPAALAQEAVSRLRLPTPVIRLNPAPPAPQLVFVPTWLWLDPSVWRPVAATASVPGLSVTATATPVRAVWVTGDGATVTCTGAGTPWRVGGDPSAASPSCGHTYRTSSARQPGGVFPVRVSVTWAVSWRGGGSAGGVPDLVTTGVVAVRVVQSNAVN
ncbi:MAG: hypothetical protein HYR62_08480 [Actinobacteria bacterium]|nr:hypothetical protein [Actinomycetota bacterium]MBI3686216.1 hypothetical protein [Actinomycetota bacterium]